MKDQLSLQTPGTFVVGCNYWASHAGAAMWSDWRPDVVENDLRELSRAGLQVLRVFLLWPDFQPLTNLYNHAGRIPEHRFGEQPLPEDEFGQAGVSAVAIDRFAHFASLCRRYKLRLIVGLLTGWMSGRLFLPPALEGRNVLTDPFAIKWSVRLVRFFVRRFRDDAAIMAWDLGNECNCMGDVDSQQAWLWTHSIAAAIRSEDRTRPIVSGMHSLGCWRDAPWTILDQAELTDVLTTHPYPLFTPHCDLDPIGSPRSCLHATAESRFYGDIGGRPALAEEVGTLGPMLASDKIAASYIRTNLLSLWANDCHGLLWWCAYEQKHLTNAPYDWCAVEKELGMLRQRGKPRPVLAEFTRFRRFLEKFPFKPLPPRRTHAVCILSDLENPWGVAYSSFILAKQAGVEIEFQLGRQPLRKADLYLLPSLNGDHSLTQRKWAELLARVRAGATLFITWKDATLASFEEMTGLCVQTRRRRTGPADISLADDDGGHFAFTASPIRMDLAATRATVLASEPDGNPAFSVAPYGRGKIFFLSVPIELELTGRPGIVHGPDAIPYWQFYRQALLPAPAARAIVKTNPAVGLTEHNLDAKGRLAIAINYSPEPVRELFRIAGGWRLDKTYLGKVASQKDGQLACNIGPHDAAVFSMRRAGRTKPA